MDDMPRPCTCTTVRRSSRILARAFDAALHGTGVSVTQLAVLRAVDRHRGAPLARVADDLCMDRTSLYRALRPLEGRGWIRSAPGADARSRTASVTAAGRRALATADPVWAETQEAIVERFGRERWAALVVELQVLSRCARDASRESSSEAVVGDDAS